MFGVIIQERRIMMGFTHDLIFIAILNLKIPIFVGNIA